jgi:phosphohistidine phosphatase SixA
MLPLVAVLCLAPAAGPRSHPGTVLVIRHAEKPDGDADAHLSPAGRRRADALTGLFRRTAARPDPFPAPDFVLAAGRSKRSNRCAETVAPLAKELGLDIDDRIDSDDVGRVAAELGKPRYAGRAVLVCWHHGKIPELLHALGVSPRPKRVDDGLFDRVWVVNYDDGGRARLAVRPQALVPGDETD